MPASLASAGSSQQKDRLFVRARFPFEGSDLSALSFQAGDVIEVITCLSSGWWDGILGVSRGWFPSNFVEEMNPEVEEGFEEDWKTGDLDEDEWHDDGEIGLNDLAMEMMGHGDLDVGKGGSKREDTDRTVMALQPSAMPKMGNILVREDVGEDVEGDLEDAWVPSLTPDGQVSAREIFPKH